MRRLSRLVLSCVPVLVILACGISVNLDTGKSTAEPKTLSRLDEISTMVAATVEALTQQAQQAQPATATPTPTPTSTPLPPTLSVSAATDCYAGPSRTYGFVITLRPGTIATVVGKDTADNYWIIEAPGYPGTVCWLSGEYAKLSGDTGYLPSPATPIASYYTLDEPRNLRVSCSSETIDDDDDEDETEWTVVFQWKNTDPNQTAVRVFRNGWQMATLGAHASSFTDVFVTHHHKRHGVTYGVQAVNGKWVSSIVTIDLHHCDD